MKKAGNPNFFKGYVSPRRGKTYEEIYGKEKAKKIGFQKGNKIGIGNRGRKGQIAWNKGLTKETDKRVKAISESLTGNKLSEKTKEKLRQYKGSLASNWQGGISKKPYSFDFNKELKELIKRRDNYTCQLCDKNPVHSAIHHIDYNKKNSNPINLILLCRICNSKVNFNREYWTKYFQIKL